MDLSIARLRPKRIFVLGEIKKPGGYTVHSYATVFNSLYSIGGPTLRGSLRDIRVLRNGKTVARVDLYDYLTGAEQTNDVRVQTNDQLFVPVRAKTVTLTGEVRKPWIFELKEGEDLSKLLKFAGDLTAEAYAERIKIQRIIPIDQRTPGELERREITVDLVTAQKAKRSIKLEDQDVVVIGSILELKRNYVTIDGAVYRPGSYQIERFPTLKSLIRAADSLRPEAFVERADIDRMRADSTRATYKVDLRLVLGKDASEDFTLEPWDRVRIYSIYDITPRRTVTISGHVKNPGTYPYADSLTLYDLVFPAGGLQDSLFWARTYVKRAELIRLTEDGITKSIIPFSLDSLLQGYTELNRSLQPLDEVVIHEVEVERLTEKYVTIAGSVRYPRLIELTEKMTIKDAILQAGGLTEDAWHLWAELSRMRNPFMADDTLSEVLVIPLPDLSTASVDSEESEFLKTFELQHRDHIFVRSDPNFEPQRIVSISGEVKYPGNYSLRVHNERLSDLVERTGGVTLSGYLGGGKIRRGGVDVTVDFAHALEDRYGDEDIILQEGDVITIPRKPNAVSINGEVANPGLLGYIKGDNLWDYIERSGG